MDETPQWYVLRDLSRPNAKLSAFEKLTGRGVRCFTPMVKKPIERRGKHGWKDVPYMRDLLFAHSTRDVLDPFMRPGLKLQYRYIYGGFLYLCLHEDRMRFGIGKPENFVFVCLCAHLSLSLLLYIMTWRNGV